MNSFTNSISRWGLALCLTLSMMVLYGQQVSAQKPMVVDRNGEIVQGGLAQTGQSVVERDSLALVALYLSTNGDRWVNNDGWLTEMVEFWHGVTQIREIQVAEDEFEWRVTRLSLDQNDLTGELPPEIGLLDELTQFYLLRNNLAGPIPQEIGQMKSLVNIRFGDNQLSGVPPWEALVSLPNLSQLQLRANQLTGDIPPVVGQFPSLRFFDMMTVPFTGTIPNEFGDIQTLVKFEVGPSHFSGPMPDFGEMENLDFFQVRMSPLLDPGPFPEFLRNLNEKIRWISLKGSNRTGPIPAWLNELSQLETLIIGWDELEGEIPDLTFNENLTRLTIRPSNISGPLPDWLGLMPNLEKLQIKNSPITGPIPQSLANAPSLRRLRLGGLQLDGPLPDLRNLELTRLYLGDLGFEIESIPEWIPFIVGINQLFLPNNGFTGQIPESLGELPLAILYLADNPGLTGPLPNWLVNGQASNLVHLYLNNNTGLDIAGKDMSELEFLIDHYPRMMEMGLAGLGLTGEIPLWIGDFTNMRKLTLGNNELSGPIPETMGEMLILDSLDLSYNNLSGQIPQSFANLGRIGQTTVLLSLHLEGNQDLTGPIPMNFTQWDPTRMFAFHYHDTGLCEPTDPAFHNWLEGVATPRPDPRNPGTYQPGLRGSVKGTGVSCDPASAEIGEVADRVRLRQNYPNPFNPSTTISYSVPTTVHVELSVYDVLGQRVATLVNETISAGQHQVVFDASRLSSGTYIYRLQAGEYSLTQSMMLIK